MRAAQKAAAGGAPAPEVLMHGRVEVIFYRGPLPRLNEAPPTEAELEFRDLIAGEVIGERVEVRPEFHRWSESVRIAWERENVVWLHGYVNGKPVWRRERPPPELEQPAAKGTASNVQRFKTEASLILNPEEGQRHDGTGKEARSQAHRQQPRQQRAGERGHRSGAGL